uniref:Cytochrome c oxidase polypeptide VIIc n=1 Tax=Romanomermis culicivorax TaxID=13658 RepID=A0A915KUF7_ROMCU
MLRKVLQSGASLSSRVGTLSAREVHVSAVVKSGHGLPGGIPGTGGLAGDGIKYIPFNARNPRMLMIKMIIFTAIPVWLPFFLYRRILLSPQLIGLSFNL